MVKSLVDWRVDSVPMLSKRIRSSNVSNIVDSGQGESSALGVYAGGGSELMGRRDWHQDSGAIFPMRHGMASATCQRMSATTFFW
jgi:hypothetical protein